MSKWNLVIDVAECTNCQLCTLSAMDEYVDNDWPGYAAAMPKHGHRWIDILQKERGQVPMIDIAYVPTMCNHCDEAPCIKAAGDDAISKRDDGIVLIDPDKAKALFAEWKADYAAMGKDPDAITVHAWGTHHRAEVTEGLLTHWAELFGIDWEIDKTD